MTISEQQATLRLQLADNLRADSDAIRDHLRLVEHLVDRDTNGLWSDTYGFSVKDVEIRFDWRSANKEAHRQLTHALELKVVGLLPSLCREVLEDAAKRAEVAVSRLIDTAPPDDATALAKVLGTAPPAPL